MVKNKCDALRDLVPFVQFKKRKKHPWRSDTFSKVAGFSNGHFYIWSTEDVLNYLLQIVSLKTCYQYYSNLLEIRIFRRLFKLCLGLEI